MKDNEVQEERQRLITHVSELQSKVNDLVEELMREKAKSWWEKLIGK